MVRSGRDHNWKRASAAPSPDAATVHQLMGALSVLPEYAVTDEDYLEFIYALMSSERRPAQLFEQLRDKHLLVLGSGLCDWLVRLFLRTKAEANFYDALIQLVSGETHTRSARYRAALQRAAASEVVFYYENHMARFLLDNSGKTAR